MLERLRTDRVILADSALALLLFGVGVWEVLAEPLEDDVVEGPLALNLFAVALSTLPIAARRRAPLAAAATVFGAIALRALAADPLEIYPPFLAALVAATRWRPTPRRGRLCLEQRSPLPPLPWPPPGEAAATRLPRWCRP